MSSWFRYVPLDDHPYYVKEGSVEGDHASFWELPAGVNTENVQEVRVAGNWSVGCAHYELILLHLQCQVW